MHLRQHPAGLGALGVTSESIFVGTGASPPPDAQCPPGYVLESAGTGFARSWYCTPTRQPQRASAPAQAPQTQVFNPTITVSPAIQTQVSPQISPVFSQMQDSPYASQGAATSQLMPGGMTASTAPPAAPSPAYDPSVAILAFMREQRELDAARAEQERRERLQAEQTRLEQEAARQRYAEAEAQRQREANQAAQQAAQQSAQQLAQQAAEREAREREIIEREQAAREAQNAAMQADYQAALRASQQTQPSAFTSSTVIPSGTTLPAALQPQQTVQTVAPKSKLPVALAIVAGAIVVYAATTRKGRRK